MFDTGIKSLPSSEFERYTKPADMFDAITMDNDTAGMIAISKSERPQWIRVSKVHSAHSFRCLRTFVGCYASPLEVPRLALEPNRSHERQKLEG